MDPEAGHNNLDTFYTLIHIDEPTFSRNVSNVTTTFQEFSHTEVDNRSFPHVNGWKTWNSAFRPLGQKRLHREVIIHLKRTS